MEFFTTSQPINIQQFIETEVKERKNYSITDVKRWIKKYFLDQNSQLLWVTTKPWIAARYQMNATDWDDCENIYKKNPKKWKVRKIDNGTIIKESDDGDEGFLMILD